MTREMRVTRVTRVMREMRVMRVMRTAGVRMKAWWNEGMQRKG